MDLDLATAFDFISRVALSEKKVKDGIVDLVDYCESQLPSNVWEQIRGLDFEGDVTRLAQWLEAVLTNEPPAENIQAFWFGLYNPITDDQDTSCDLYLSGSVDFDPEDETGDWTCWEQDSYLPDQKYAHSQVLDSIYKLVAGKDEAEIGEYVLCLGYACLAIREVCDKIESRLLLGTRKWRGVAAGFDSGDFIVLGRIRDSGWS